MPGGTDRCVSTGSSFGEGRGTLVVRAGGWCLAHCWVLRQQGREGLVPRLWCWLFLGLFVSGFLAAPIMHVCVCGVCGLGLLFENYIVDASIFYEKQFPRI